jgi:hypothetical protein
MPAIPQIPAAPVVAPKQVTYPNVVIDVQPLPDGNRMLVIQAPAGAPTEVLLFPMSGDYADELGKKLTAPHIVPANNGHAPGG